MKLMKLQLQGPGEAVAMGSQVICTWKICAFKLF